MRLPSFLTAAAFASLGALASTSAHADGPIVLKCPTIEGEASIYGIGGSTMGSLLGPMLETVLEEQGFEFRRWGLASSGLARPDFHNWPKETPAVMQKHKPDIVIVSLGTNDYQPLYVSKKEWIKQEDAAWETTYGDRVDALLEAIAADDPERLIIWSGPYAFKGENAEKRAPIVNRIMKERVEAFAKRGGRAIFHDAFAPTLGQNGRPLDETVLPGKGKKPVKIRSKDGVHLTADAVRALLATPIVDMITPCLGKSTAKQSGH